MPRGGRLALKASTGFAHNPLAIDIEYIKGQSSGTCNRRNRTGGLGAAISLICAGNWPHSFPVTLRPAALAKSRLWHQLFSCLRQERPSVYRELTKGTLKRAEKMRYFGPGNAGREGAVAASKRPISDYMKIPVTFHHRGDGGVSVWSDDVAGFALWSSDSAALLADVTPPLEDMASHTSCSVALEELQRLREQLTRYWCHRARVARVHPQTQEYVT
jgi:hypothetical protein